MNGDVDVWGTLVSDLQQDIAVSDEERYIAGTLHYLSEGQLVTDWGPGHFLALHFDNIDPNATSVLVGLDPSEGSGLVELIDDPDKSGVFKITNEIYQVLKIISSDGTHTNEQTYRLADLFLEEPQPEPMVGVTIAAVNGNTQVDGVRASELQSGVTVTVPSVQDPTTYAGDISGTIVNYSHDVSAPDTAWLDGYNLYIDITPGEGETIERIKLTPEDDPDAVTTHNGHYLIHGIDQFGTIIIKSAKGDQTLTQRFYLNLTTS